MSDQTSAQNERELLEEIKCDIENYLKNNPVDPEEKLVRNRSEVIHKLNEATRLPSCSDFLSGQILAYRWFLFMIEEI